MTPVDNSTHGSASVAKSNPPSVGHRWSSLTSDPRMKSSAVLLYKQWARAVCFTAGTRDVYRPPRHDQQEGDGET
ncbi:hypothetical protein RRG08_037368 [Elysia crispata]|uniref:Uncharacterized protein n=1 Tax=Elysia crispata TaxID=231223 RepID=A0AAE1DV81_9GAST|nr:hypothetical protein RRG08_037368 [Elysia crispata]